MAQIGQILGSITLACVPAFIWGYIFYQKNPENRRASILTFLLGALAVFPILLYKYLWDYFPWINAFRLAEYYSEDIIGLSNFLVVPLSAVITFMFVGIIEEVMKLLSVEVIDDDEIKDIDDAIELFIIAALGFSFTENILYFYNIWILQGPQNLLLPFLFRSTFSTFAHLMFSGILGYYYGTAHFAKPILQEELKNKRSRWVIWMHKLFNIRKEKLFHQQRITEGLLIAIGLHAIFNIFLEMNLLIAIAPFLVGGYVALNYLFAKKENHKKYGLLLRGLRNHPHPKSGVYFTLAKLKN